MPAPSLRRIYCFSDTYGRSKNPFTQDDADAIISTDFRSFPLDYSKREFDIYGRENITDHVVRVVVHLHEQVRNSSYFSKETKAEFENTITGIFINAAPRTSKDNGSLFYVATIKNLRIVTTSPAGLSSIKDKIETLGHLPNLNNNLYGPTEQFRSSYTAHMLHPDHGLKLENDNIDAVIPDYDDDKWELAYVDRFGNMLTHCADPVAKWKEVTEAAKQTGGNYVKLIIGNVSQRAYLGKSLKDAEPGDLVIYPNGDLEILRKWMEDEDSFTRLYKAAYFQFGKPDIGAKVRVHVPSDGTSI